MKLGVPTVDMEAPVRRKIYAFGENRSAVFKLLVNHYPELSAWKVCLNNTKIP
jgi:hypothetical protein